MATVYSYSKSIEVANSVGAYILNIQNDSLSNENSDGYFRVAVSGGSLGKVLNKGLSLNKEISEKIQWDKWIIFFSDERLVPLDHEDSNYGLLNSLVLKSLPDGKSPPKVITINEDLLKSGGSSEELASDYEKNLLQNFPSGEEIPSFDLILLGCGPDGHTCSLFPGHKLLKEDKKIIAHIDDSPKPPPKRITITFPILKKAKNIAFVAEGAGKAPVLKEIFAQKEDPTYPSAIVNKIAGKAVSWFVDDSAIKGIDTIIPSKY